MVRGAPSRRIRIVSFATYSRFFARSVRSARSMGRKKSGSKSCRSYKSRPRKTRLNENGNETEQDRKFSEKRDDPEEANRPIDVHSRLCFPLVRQNSPDDFDESDRANESLVLSVKPRFVFVSSLCAVCLKRSKVVCERCRMVSYCSPSHRNRGSTVHRDLCEALAEIRASIASTVSADSKERLDPEEYRICRLRLLAILESRSGRPLQLWEREIVLYPRVCRVCHSFGEALVCCAACGMECFCPSHREDHEKWCEEFRVLRRCLSLQHKHGCVEPRIPWKRPESVVDEGRERVSDIGFDELMRRMYADSLYYREMDCYTYSMLSHLCTIPLTALYAMQISRPEWRDKPELTVHMLGAEFQFEGVNLHVWERMFLHLLPSLKRLRLTLVGPELQLPAGVPVHLLSRIELCPECKAADRDVVVRFRPSTLYHEMSRADGAAAEKPDIVCAFNPGLYRKTGFAGRDTWPETIREFLKMRTPVVVTSYTEQEIFWEIRRIKSIERDVDVVLEPRRNPFASVKPDRNFVSDHTNPLIYKNYYVAVVKGRSVSS